MQNIDMLKKRLKSNGKLDEDKLTLLKSSAKRVQEIGPLIVQMSEEYDELEEEIESTQNGGRIVISEVAYPGVKMTIANVSSFIHNKLNIAHLFAMEQKYAYVRSDLSVKFVFVNNTQ